MVLNEMKAFFDIHSNFNNILPHTFGNVTVCVCMYVHVKGANLFTFRIGRIPWIWRNSNAMTIWCLDPR